MRVLLSAAIVASLVVGLVASVSRAAPLRKWTDATGQFSVEAEFVELKAGEVHLRKADGSVITVPAAKLSEPDRIYLSNRAGSRPATTPAPQTTAPASTPEAPSDEISLSRAMAGGGKVSRAAWSKFTQAFRRFDADADDAVTKAELAAAGHEDLLLKLADADADGKLVRGEWSQLAQSFPRLDKNKDGGVDLAELEAAAAGALAKSSGTASLAGANSTAAANTGPTVWRGNIDGRGQIELSINGNQIVGRETGPGGRANPLGSGTYVMSGNGALGNMDATYTEGPQAGQTCQGIYQMQGDTLRWCVNNRGRRPQEFSTGNGNWLMTLERAPQQ